jgi:alkanesulfonate monooxygenase SsuD/methylene tetrahydromethanopterin reductase-like flavin-dependent oxidoreductase (luciferase family)
VRLGIVAPLPDGPAWSAWSDTVEHADSLGIDAVHLPSTATADTLLAAAALAARTRWIRVVAEVRVDTGPHPVHLAERIAVADQCLGGRLTVVLAAPDGPDGLDLLAETLTVLELALACRPFSHDGPRWTIPARLPANDAATWTRLTVTPSPAQPELPLWLTGTHTAALAAASGHPWLAGPDDDATAAAGHWAARPDIPVTRPRPAVRAWVTGPTGATDPVATAAALAAERDAWGLGMAFLPVTDRAELDVMAARLRPRVRLAELPSGLERFWDHGFR